MSRKSAMSEQPPPPKPTISAEAVIAISALFVSVVSLGIGIYQGYLNARMVAAASWPYLTFGTSNIQSNGQSGIRFLVQNGGVGPARIETFQIFVKGKPVANADELVAACCGLDRATTPPDELRKRVPFLLSYSGPGTVVAAGGTFEPFSWPIPTDETARAEWDTFNAERGKLVTAKACYCSVLDDCWETDFSSTRHKSVLECKPVEPQYR
jgi:hypothetical protein